MVEFITVIIAIVVWWCSLFAVFSGLGLLGYWIFGLPVRSAEAWLLSFWIGWAFVLLILQLWHLWLKIDVWAFAVVATLGTGGLLANRKALWSAMRLALTRNFALMAILLLLALWVANRAIGPLQNGDTGLYHMGSVAWAASYPIVPGLGNLHERLAFNSTFFLYAAMLSVGPWSEKSRYLVNGLPLLVLLAQLLLSVATVISRNPTHRSYHIFNVLFLAPTLGLMFNPHFSSLTPDLMIFILSVVVTSRLYYFLVGPKSDIRNSAYDVFFITIVCITGITVKLNYMVFGISTILIAVLVWSYRYSRDDKKPLIIPIVLIAVMNVLLLGIWVLRGVILSGYMVFPYTVGSVPVQWRVPRPIALSVANYIRSWPRAPGVYWTEVLGNWNWFRPWLSRFPYEYTKPLITAICALIIYLILIIRARLAASQLNHSYLAVIVPACISLIIWFFVAPDPRFSGASFWIAGAGFTALTILHVGLKVSTATIVIENFLCLLFFLYLFQFPNHLLIPPNQKDGPFYGSPRAEYMTVSLNNINYLNLPTKDGLCWDIPLPCTPYFRSNLHLRGDMLESGFILDDTFTFADMHQSSVPLGISISPGIGIALMGATDAWSNFDREKNMLWMREHGKLLIYSAQRQYIKLTLKPSIININGSLRNEDALRVSLNKTSKTELPLRPGINTEVVLELQPDFNIIALDLVQDGHGANQTDAVAADRSLTGVAFSAIELASIELLR